jgi:hypothetical protein
MLCSCASNKKSYEFEDLDFQSFAYSSAENRTVYITYKYLNIQEVYASYLKSGQINKDGNKSCFNDGNSVNFVSIGLDNIPQFRPYVSRQKYDVTYKSSNVTDDKGNYESLHIEKRVERMTVEQETCVKAIDGIKHYITSERYAYQ